MNLERFTAIKNLMNNPSATEGERSNARKKYEKYRHQFESVSNSTPPPRLEAPKSNSRLQIAAPTPNNGSWFSRNKGKVALGIGVGTAAAYGIHKYRQNKKKKKEEEARRQAELASQKESSSRRFFK